MLLSFLIACYRSEKTIGAVVDEIIGIVSERPSYDYEVILVNDHSPDRLSEVLFHLAEENSRIRVISLAKNVGKANAVLAGLSRTKGDYVVFLDDDGQCPVDHVWELLEAVEGRYDMAVAWYPHKKQAWWKNLGSRVNKQLMMYLIGQPREIEFSNFSVRRRFLCEEMMKYKNPYPNLQALVLQVTHNIKMVPMEERERMEGESGYTFLKSLKLLVNGCTSFSVKPLRLASFLGLLFSFFGFFMGCYTILHKLFCPDLQAGYSSIMAVLLFIGGILMLLLGIIGEYLGRIYICINHAPQYVIQEEYNTEK